MLTGRVEPEAARNAAWFYDLHAGLSAAQREAFEAALDALTVRLGAMVIGSIDDLEREFDATIRELELVTGDSPLDEGGVLDYGGLNDFFGTIVSGYGFPVEKGEFAQVSDFVFRRRSK